jgi:NAD-specific glutamate dehydrogenase
VAQLFFMVGDRYRLDWLTQQAERLVPANRWQRWALRAFESDLESLRRDLAQWVLEDANGEPVAEAVESYAVKRADRHQRLDRFMDMLRHDSAIELDPLLVAAKQIRALAN